MLCMPASKLTRSAGLLAAPASTTCNSLKLPLIAAPACTCRWRGVAPKPSPSAAAAGTAVGGPKAAEGAAGKAGAGSASRFIAAKGSIVGCGPSCSSNGTCGPALDEVSSQ